MSIERYSVSLVDYHVCCSLYSHILAYRVDDTSNPVSCKRRWANCCCINSIVTASTAVTATNATTQHCLADGCWADNVLWMITDEPECEMHKVVHFFFSSSDSFLLHECCHIDKVDSNVCASMKKSWGIARNWLLKLCQHSPSQHSSVTFITLQ